MGILVELKSDAILSRLLGGGEFPQAELFRVPGRSDGNVSYCITSSLRTQSTREPWNAMV